MISLRIILDILCEQCNPYEAKVYFSHRQSTPKLVLANEFENSLCEYSHCPYEIQILIPSEETEYAI